MALSPGTTLGPYAIESPLGAGGMGEVYKARDTRLDRTVAIKVLPEHVATDPDLKQRFERPLTRRMPVAIILATLTVGTLVLPVAAQEFSPRTAADIEQFLLTAEVVDARPIGKGVTNSWRLTLSDGTTTHDAAFQSINQQKNVAGVGRRTELQFKDSYHFNIAAYRLAVLLGLDDMVPVSVERRWRGQRGALVWWVDSAWDETERKARGLFPPERGGVDQAALSDGRVRRADLRHGPQRRQHALHEGLASMDDRLHAGVSGLAQAAAPRGACRLRRRVGREAESA